DEETERADKDGCCFRYSAKAVQHDLEDFFPNPDSWKTDWQRGDRSLDRHHCKEIQHRHGSAQSVSGTEKRGKSGKMRDDRCAERDERGTPVMREKEISRREFDQFFTTGKFFGKQMK